MLTGIRLFSDKNINPNKQNPFIQSIWTRSPQQKSVDRQAWASSADQDQMLQNAASDQGWHWLPLIEQISEASKGSKTDFFKLQDKYGKEGGTPIFWINMVCIEYSAD